MSERPAPVPTPPRMPGSVRAACVLWGALGYLLLIGAVGGVFDVVGAAVTDTPRAEMRGRRWPTGGWATPAGLAVGTWVLVTGLRVGLGWAAGVRVVAGASVVLAALALVLGVNTVRAAERQFLAATSEVGSEMLTAGRVVMASGLGLLLSGGLAAAGGRRYRAWQAGAPLEAAPRPALAAHRRRLWHRTGSTELAVAVLIAAVVSGYCLYQRQPLWRRHTSVEGQFHVDLPAPPREDIDRVANVRTVGTGVSVEGTLLRGYDEEYVVASLSRSWWPAPVGPSRPVAGIRPYPTIDDPNRELAAILASVPGVRQVIPVRLTSVKRPDVVDAEFELADGRIGIARLCKTGARVYILTACGPWRDGATERFRRFVESFGPDE